MAITNTVVSAAPNWVKASASNANQNCVEVRFNGNTVLIRDSKYLRDPRNKDHPARQPIISIPASHWTEFLEIVADRGQTGDGLPAIEYSADGHISLRASNVTLTYTPGEWNAFCDGIQKGEFHHPMLPVLASTKSVAPPRVPSKTRLNSKAA